MVRKLLNPKDEHPGLEPPAIGSLLSEAACKDLAVALALRGVGHVSPNPHVGTVIVDREHKLLGYGAHLKVGEGHAEANAIAKIKEDGLTEKLIGARAFVTLEPCAHKNRTGSCAKLLSGFEIEKVTAGALDPNPKVNGKGLAILEEAGISTELDETWNSDCKDLAEVFVWNMKHQKPFIAMKAATGLDGTMARKGDQRVWITGKRSRQYGHFLRQLYDSVMVGSKTVELDNPTLDPRDALLDPSRKRVPKRIVLDPEASVFDKIPVDQINLLKTSPEKVYWVSTQKAWETKSDAAAKLDELGAKRITVAMGKQGSFDLDELIDVLWKNEIQSILLEGGAGLYGNFIQSRLVQKLHLFQAPKNFSGDDLIKWTDHCSAPTLSNIKITPLDIDWHIEADICD